MARRKKRITKVDYNDHCHDLTLTFDDGTTKQFDTDVDLFISASGRYD